MNEQTNKQTNKRTNKHTQTNIQTNKDLGLHVQKVSPKVDQNDIFFPGFKTSLH